LSFAIWLSFRMKMTLLAIRVRKLVL